MEKISTWIIKLSLIGLSLILALLIRPALAFIEISLRGGLDGPYDQVIPLAGGLVIAMALSTLVALIAGVLVTGQYEKGLSFHRKTKRYLEISFLGFFGSFLVSILSLVLSLLNDFALVFPLLFSGLALGFLVLSQAALVLSRLIGQGLDLQEDQDLTI